LIQDKIHNKKVAVQEATSAVSELFEWDKWSFAAQSIESERFPILSDTQVQQVYDQYCNDLSPSIVDLNIADPLSYIEELKENYKTDELVYVSNYFWMSVVDEAYQDAYEEFFMSVSFDDLNQDLISWKIDDNLIDITLTNIWYQLIWEKRYNNVEKILLCAAQKYYSTNSMVMLGNVYEEWLKDSETSEFVINKDQDQAFFRLMTAFDVWALKLDLHQWLVWEIIWILESIDSDIASQQEKVYEERVTTFIAQKYPEYENIKNKELTQIKKEIEQFSNTDISDLDIKQEFYDAKSFFTNFRSKLLFEKDDQAIERSDRLLKNSNISTNAFTQILRDTEHSYMYWYRISDNVLKILFLLGSTDGNYYPLVLHKAIDPSTLGWSCCIMQYIYDWYDALSINISNKKRDIKYYENLELSDFHFTSKTNQSTYMVTYPMPVLESEAKDIEVKIWEFFESYNSKDRNTLSTKLSKYSWDEIPQYELSRFIENRWRKWWRISIDEIVPKSKTELVTSVYVKVFSEYTGKKMSDREERRKAQVWISIPQSTYDHQALPIEELFATMPDFDELKEDKDAFIDKILADNTIEEYNPLEISYKNDYHAMILEVDIKKDGSISKIWHLEDIERDQIN